MSWKQGLEALKLSNKEVILMILNTRTGLISYLNYSITLYHINLIMEIQNKHYQYIDNCTAQITKEDINENARSVLLQ